MALAEDLFRGLQSPGTLTDPSEGVAIASATTIAPTRYLTTISGAVAISTITPPYPGFTGTIAFLPSGIFTLALGGNIGLASTAVIGKVMFLTYSATNALWYPSY